ncbi:LAQU0S11e03444g1_1 [Lachancea quebecensis]|uniref:LAQU0S11e03444g1_1 n=1 Tax=Lachancea quebecensis TaxID=1654605 RepID=A0A0N7MM05_9SACH|nr:LAQU0S11e03444g1_1 [Lachancea quebecensis]
MTNLNEENSEPSAAGGSRNNMPSGKSEGIKARDNLKVPDKNSSASMFLHSVSFDTVPLLAGLACEESHEPCCNDHSLEYTEDEFYDNESTIDFAHHYDGGERLVVPFTRSSQLRGQPNASISMINSTVDGLDGIYVGKDGKITRTDYPTRPTIVNDALVINRSHKDWSTLWSKRRQQIEQRVHSPAAHFVFPEILFPSEKPTALPASDGYTPLSKEEKRKALVIGKKVGFPNSPRTILCHITGRKHTWTPLDWLLKEFSHDVDHLVIISNIPKMSNHRSRSRSRSRSAAPRSESADGRGDKTQHKHEHWLEWASGYDAAVIKDTLNNILRYVTTILPKNRAVKVTVEIVIGKIQKIAADAINVYNPNLIVMSSLRHKPNESIVKWKSKKTIDRFCQTCPVPIVLVPVKKMTDLEDKILNELSAMKGTHKLEQKGSAEVEDSTRRIKGTPQKGQKSQQPETGSRQSSSHSFSDDDQSDTESVSSSVASSGATDSRLQRKLADFRKKAQAEIAKIERDSRLSYDQKLISKVDAITESSLRFTSRLDEMDYSTESFAELKRVFTGDTKPQTGGHRKSMLDVMGPSGKAKKTKTPSIKVKESTSPSRKSQIKFAPEVKARDGRDRILPSDSRPIERSLSYDLALRPESSQGTSCSSREMDLRKVRSASGLKPTKSTTSSSSDYLKKKSKGLFSFFKAPDSNPNSSASSVVSSRRSSVGSESSGIVVGTPNKKKRSRFFGFVKS